MPLKIAELLKQESSYSGFPTAPDTPPTSNINLLVDIPTVRHVRQAPEPESDFSTWINSDGMPLYCYRSENPKSDDYRWVQKKLWRIKDSTERLKIAVQYSKLYKSKFDTEPIEHQKVNRARFAANSWLLQRTK